MGGKTKEQLEKELEEATKKNTELTKALEEKAVVLLSKKEGEGEEIPGWLKGFIVQAAQYFGVTAKDFEGRVKIAHPTPKDPVLLVDGKAVISWV